MDELCWEAQEGRHCRCLDGDVLVRGCAQFIKRFIALFDCDVQFSAPGWTFLVVVVGQGCGGCLKAESRDKPRWCSRAPCRPIVQTTQVGGPKMPRVPTKDCNMLMSP